VRFDRPPVNEVVLAIQFAGHAIDLEVLGRVAGRLKNAFPRREQHPPLPPLAEDFSGVVQGPQIVIRTSPDLPRTWFVSDDQVRLVQVQSDRFAFNWRRRSAEQAYPGYNAIREEFVAHIDALMRDVREVNPAVAAINVCEVTYVNELEPPEQQRGRPELSTFLRLVEATSGDFLPSPEDATFQARWRIPGDDQAPPRGRLYASAEPALRSGASVPIYLLNLVARMVATETDVDTAVDLLDEGHTWIVRGFKDITTEEMHRHWRLREDR